MYRPFRIVAVVAAFALVTGGASAAASSALSDARIAAEPDLSGYEAARTADAARLAELEVQIANLEEQNSAAEDDLSTALAKLAKAKKARDAARAAAAAAAAAAAQGSGSSTSNRSDHDDDHDDDREDERDDEDDDD